MLIKVKAIPESKYQEVKKGKDNFEIRIREKKEKGVANKKIIEILKKEFPHSKKIRLLKGAKSQSKIFEIN